MVRENKEMMRAFAAAFSALLIFLGAFANGLHTHHQTECGPANSACAAAGQAVETVAASENHKDGAGDCPACSYLNTPQGAYSGKVSLPGKLANGQYSAAGHVIFHNIPFIEYLPRAPPSFIA
ncbi:MAG: hypothetical protein WC637_17905 [Victivallales bacterium]|jgi:hypothetical protein